MFNMQEWSTKLTNSCGKNMQAVSKMYSTFNFIFHSKHQSIKH